ncbi:hypothetical protein SDC9_154051 [bioreactor metagenome]|uniref:Uncharacterized protein n=1 Tax=bioreactor metagenome TaxID=1076179 RepID=A0A645F2I3_9ZZZZ
MNYKTAKRLSDFLAIISVAVAVLIYLLNENEAAFIGLGLLALAIVIAALVIRIKFYKCPHCAAKLPVKTFDSPERCPACGGKLEF